MTRIDKEFKRIDPIVNDFAGWLTSSERKFLYGSAKECSGKGVIVEIGSWQGKSASLLASGSKSGKKIKVYAIDPHQDSYVHVPRLGAGVSTFENFKKNIKKVGVEELVVPIVKLSKDAAVGWNQSIEFLWIDGDHSYVGAKLDLDLFYDHVIEGGLVAYHDATFEEVKSVVKKELFDSGRFAKGGIAGSIVYARKITERPLTLWEKLGNKWVISLINVHDIARSAGFLRSPLKRLKVFFDRV